MPNIRAWPENKAEVAPRGQPLTSLLGASTTLTPFPTAPGPIPPVRIETSSPTVAEGQTLDLSCVVAGQAHAQVTWYKRGGSLPTRHQVHSGRRVGGGQPGQAMDSGWRGCWFLAQRSRVRSVCGLWEDPLSYSSLPMAAQVRGSRLYIFQASPADAGEYVCRASNGVEASITVKVTRTQGANFAYREWGHQAGLGQRKGTGMASYRELE